MHLYTHILNNILNTHTGDMTVSLWHVSQSEKLQSFQHKDIVTSVDFHPVHDRYFISGGFDGMVNLWDIITSNEEPRYVYVYMFICVYVYNPSLHTLHDST